MRRVSGTVIVFFIIFLAFVVLLAPVVVAWALNAVFGAHIVITGKTWLALWVLMLVFGSTGSYVRR